MGKTDCLFVLLIVTFAGCCKDKNEGRHRCNNLAFTVTPFIEYKNNFSCNDTSKFIGIFRSKNQIDSLSPDCVFTSSVIFPVDQQEMLYLIYGRTSYYYSDTFITALLKDTCNKKLTYTIDIVQRDTNHLEFPGTGFVFCEVENIPADYQVEVKYKYVPIQ